MIILGLDTSTATASGALIENGRLINEEVRCPAEPKSPGSSPSPRTNHAIILLPLVHTLLEGAKISLQQISALAISIGPGSFTGLRIGLSTVMGLTYGWEVPVVGVPTLLAIASRVRGWNGLICPFLDARKKEVYAALFRRDEDGELTRLTEDTVCAPQRILDRSQDLGHGGCLFIGDGTNVYGDLIRACWGNQAMISLGGSYPSTAYSVACIAAERVKREDFDPPGLLAPLYLRLSEAELKKIPTGEG